MTYWLQQHYLEGDGMKDRIIVCVSRGIIILAIVASLILGWIVRHDHRSDSQFEKVCNVPGGCP